MADSNIKSAFPSQGKDGMGLIPSFQIDHSNLKPGIYVSRQDTLGNEKVTTFDIRMTAPNHEPAVQQAALHTIEHLVATYLRNSEKWKDSIIYWGPMGCQTGNYLIVKGEPSCETVREMMLEAFRFTRDFDGEVPGTKASDCGNYLLHDLPMAKWEAKRYVERLENEFCCVYPGK